MSLYTGRPRAQVLGNALTLKSSVSDVDHVLAEEGGQLYRVPATNIVAAGESAPATRGNLGVRESFDTVALLQADTLLAYSANSSQRQVTPGDIIEAGGFRYQVVASDAEYHLVSAGGVRVKAVASKGERGPHLSQSAIGTDIDDGLTAARSLTARLALDGASYSRTTDIAIASGDKIDGGGATITATAGDRMVNLVSSKQRADTIASGEPNVYRIQEQIAGLPYVDIHSDDTGAGSNFSAGDKVTISFGIDPFDADDTLWQFSRAYRIVNVDSDRIWLDEAIPERLLDGPFIPSSAASTATAYADATSYTAGDCVTANDDGDGTGTAVWRADTTHTSSGATVSADANGTWTKLCNTQGGLIGNRDGRCCIQLWDDDDLYSDIHIDGLNLVGNKSSSYHTDLLQARGNLDVLIENVDFSGKTRICTEASEHSNRITYRNCKMLLADGASDFMRPYSSYAGSALLEDCLLVGGADSRAAVFLESWGEFRGIRTRVAPAYAAGTSNNWGFFVSPGIVDLTDCVVGPFDIPFRLNFTTSAFNYTELRRPAQIRAKGCRFIMAGKGFRIADDWNPGLEIWPGNDFDIYSTGISGVDMLKLRNTRIERLTTSVSVATGQTSVGVPLPINADLWHLGGRYGPGVVLGLEGFWDSPDGGANDVSFRVEAKAISGGAERAILDTNASFDQLTISEAQAGAQQGGYSFRGVGTRCFSSSERLEFEYTSGATAGGTLYMTAVVLVGDFMEEVAS